MSPVLELDPPVETLHAEPLRKAPLAHHAIERRCNVSRRDFEHEYSLPRRPVILTDATRLWKARRWSPETLEAKVGHRVIQYRDGNGSIAFRDLSRQIAESTDAAPAPYGRNIHVFRDLPEVADDIRPRLAYCMPDWKSSRLLPKHWLFENGLEELFYGGRGAKFPGLHVDYFGMDAFLSQLYGEKEVLVFAPQDTPYLYPTAENPLVCPIKDFEHPDLERYPLYAKATPIRFTLYPGETLFCPSGWWHTTSMPDVSITLVTANWCRANWQTLVEQYRYHRQGKGRLKTEVMSTYLRFVGLALALRDRVLHGL